MCTGLGAPPCNERPVRPPLTRLRNRLDFKSSSYLHLTKIQSSHKCHHTNPAHSHSCLTQGGRGKLRKMSTFFSSLFCPPFSFSNISLSYKNSKRVADRVRMHKSIQHPTPLKIRKQKRFVSSRLLFWFAKGTEISKTITKNLFRPRRCWKV